MNIFVAGDFAPSYRLAEQIERTEFDEIFPSNIRDIISGADYSIVNFESSIYDRSFKAIKKCGPNLNCPEKSIDALKYAGFKCVTLANNHVLDYGEEGLCKTIKYCQKLQIDTVGAGKTLNDASTVLYKRIKNEVLGIVNCCEHEFSIATDKTAGACPLDVINIYKKIVEARKNATYVLVIVHGGHEHYNLPSLRMQKTYRFFIEIGADAVVNHHQHCYSGYELHMGKPIFYGIGNFAFERLNGTNKLDAWNKGYAIILSFDSNKIDYKLYPYIQYASKPSVCIIDNEIEKEEFNNQIRILNDIIANPEQLNKKNEDYYNEGSLYEQSLFEPYSSRIMYKLFTLGLLPSFLSGSKLFSIINHINCESHRDKVVFSLNRKMKK